MTFLFYSPRGLTAPGIVPISLLCLTGLSVSACFVVAAGLFAAADRFAATGRLAAVGLFICHHFPLLHRLRQGGRLFVLRY
jgi:hypothetical protein